MEILMKIDQMDKVTLMPHTMVKEFLVQSVDIEQDGERMFLEPSSRMTLGWIKLRHKVFKGWDKGLAKGEYAGRP